MTTLISPGIFPVDLYSGPVPEKVLNWLCRLNNHARADYGARSAIYAYKELAAIVLARAGLLGIRFVKWTGPCAVCGGTGKWRDYWPESEEQTCRACYGRKTKTLRFTETTLPANVSGVGGQVWHHPWEGRTNPGREIATAFYGMLTYDYDTGQECYLPIEAVESAIPDVVKPVPIDWQSPSADWRPRLPGDQLELSTLVIMLNDVEDWVESIPESHDYPLRWPLDAARRYAGLSPPTPGVIGELYNSYRLDLSRAAGGCHWCGSPDLAGHTIGRITPRLHWSLPICRTCDGRGRGRGTSVEKTPPPTMITPEIERWLKRHVVHVRTLEDVERWRRRLRS